MHLKISQRKILVKFLHLVATNTLAAAVTAHSSYSVSGQAPALSTQRNNCAAASCYPKATAYETSEIRMTSLHLCSFSLAFWRKNYTDRTRSNRDSFSKPGGSLLPRCKYLRSLNLINMKYQ